MLGFAVSTLLVLELQIFLERDGQISMIIDFNIEWTKIQNRFLLRFLKSLTYVRYV